MYLDVVSRASPIGPQIEARPPSRTMPIAPLSALPPQISSKCVAFSLEPRAGSPGTRNVKSRTGIPMQRIRGDCFPGAREVEEVSVMSIPKVLRIELRFRSSQAIAAISDANFGIKGALAIISFQCGFELEVPITNLQRNR